MPKYIPAIALTFFGAALIYVLFPPIEATRTPTNHTAGPSIQHIERASTTNESAHTEEDGLRALAQILKAAQEEQLKSAKDAQAERARLSAHLNELSSRLSALEKTMGDVASEQTETDHDEETAPAKVSEGALGRWIDERLVGSQLDPESTALALDQAEEPLAAAAGVFLDDMACGEAFCRAMFSTDNGSRPELSSLFGQPPFANEGFTIEEPDGRIALYFTRPGVKLEDLRADAQQMTGVE